jgi:hypothetical protein
MEGAPIKPHGNKMTGKEGRLQRPEAEEPLCGLVEAELGRRLRQAAFWQSAS